MSNSFKGIAAGFFASLILAGLMVLNDAMGWSPQANLVRLLTVLGTLSVTSAWMDHFIVGAIVWGLLFAAFDAVTTRPAPWLKGVIFGGIAWLLMAVSFLPLAGAGFFGAKIGSSALLGLLVLHLIYGLVLGITYGLLGTFVPVRAAVVLPKDEVVLAGPNANTMNSADINDHLPSSSPSGKTLLIIFGSLAGFFLLVLLAVEFRAVLGL